MASSVGDLPPELVATSKTKSDEGGFRADEQQNSNEDLELLEKSDSEIEDTISRIENVLQKIGYKLPDKGERLKANLRRNEIELERRKKLQSDKRLDEQPLIPTKLQSMETLDPCFHTGSSSASVAVDFIHIQNDKQNNCNGIKRKKLEDLVTASNDIDPPPKLVATSKNMFAEGGTGAVQMENQKGDLELPAKSKPTLATNMKNRPTILSPGGLAEINGLRSQYAGATNALTNDSLIDEKMQLIVNELVNVGISEGNDVGKVAEALYNHPIKAKVLFALPSHMRKSYVLGFLDPQN